jgi:hypothetical protein
MKLNARQQNLLALPANELLKPQPGFYYEPRALWSATLSRTSSNLYSVSTPIDPNTLYNGEKYPIIFTHVIMQWVTEGGLTTTVQRAGASIGLSIATAGGPRYSKHYAPMLLEPVPAAEPLDPASFATNPMLLTANPTWYRPTVNRCAWDFELPPVLPADAMLEIQLGARVPTLVDTTAATPTADINLYTPTAPGTPANWPQMTYTRQAVSIAQLSVAAATQRYQPYADALTQFLTSGGELPPTITFYAGYTGGAEAQNYPPGQQLSPREMLRQKASYNVPTNLGGLAITFDERSIDETSRATAGPLSMTTPVKVRTRNAGTQAYWWRDGAPLSIVSPTMTPAFASRLSRPLTLAPGEAFDVQLQQGVLNAPLGIGEDDDLNTFFYISFCGYAAVEA